MNAPHELVAPRSDAWATETLAALMARIWAEFAPPPYLDIAEWAERYRELSPEESPIPGRYSLDHTPVLREILAACSDPAVRK